MLDFKEILTDSDFESFCAELLAAHKWTITRPPGMGTDSGVDFLASTPPHPQTGVPLTYVVQCKHHSRPVGMSKLGQRSLADIVRKDQASGYLLMASGKITADLRSVFHDLDDTSEYHFIAWDGREIERQLLMSEEHALLRYFPLSGKMMSPSLAVLDIAQVTAVCRTASARAIRENASATYVPGLYVTRMAQREILDFHSSDASNALARETALRGLKPVTNDLREATALLKRNNAGLPEATLEELHRNQLIASRALEELESVEQMVATSQSTPSRDEAILRQLDRASSELSGAATSSQSDETPTRPPLTHSLRWLLGENMVLLARRVRRARADYAKAGKHCGLLTGSAGCGKTNLLCNIAESLSTEAPTLLMFGRQGFGAQRTIVQHVLETLATATRLPADEQLLLEIDEVLKRAGHSLHIFVDGINEARDLREMDAQIQDLMRWSSTHQVRVTVSCRDTYWPFFQSDRWEPWLRRSDQLESYTSDEFARVSPLYLRHYNIECIPSGRAQEQLRDPLLLLYFCQAYGDNQALDPTQLGVVEDIRQREVFDLYLAKKGRQIQARLGHGNSDEIRRFLRRFALHLYQNRRLTIPNTKIADATGETDTSTSDSLYLRILDEAIVIEERPTESVEIRNVGFAYEAFMEYVLADALLERVRAQGEIEPVASSLMDSVDTWPNAKGVVDFSGRALLSTPSAGDRARGMELLRSIVERGGEWVDEVLWKIIGSLNPEDWGSEMSDLLCDALSRVSSQDPVVKAFHSLNRRNKEAAQEIITVALWSVCLPHSVLWSEVREFNSASEEQQEELAQTWARRLRESESNHWDPQPVSQVFSGFLRRLLSLLPADLDHYMKIELDGRVPGPDEAERYLMTLTEFFGKDRMFLINGLFDAREPVRGLSEQRLAVILPRRVRAVLGLP